MKEDLEHTLPSSFGNWASQKLLLEMFLQEVCFVQDVLKLGIPEKPRADFQYALSHLISDNACLKSV